MWSSALHSEQGVQEQGLQCGGCDPGSCTECNDLHHHSLLQACECASDFAALQLCQLCDIRELY